MQGARAGGVCSVGEFLNTSFSIVGSSVCY